MTSRYRTLFLLGCAAAGIACGDDPGVGPDHGVGRGQFTSLQLGAPLVWMYEQDTEQVVVNARDQWGKPISGPASVTWASNAPGVATVSSAGIVTAIARGSAEISADVVIGRVRLREAIKVQVLSHSSGLVLTATSRGWQPAVAHVAAGDTVRWAAAPLNWEGVPNTTLYLMDANHAVVDSLDLSSGFAARRFDRPGVVRYCSGGCWDPPDWGVVNIQ